MYIFLEESAVRIKHTLSKTASPILLENMWMPGINRCFLTIYLLKMKPFWN